MNHAPLTCQSCAFLMLSESSPTQLRCDINYYFKPPNQCVVIYTPGGHPKCSTDGHPVIIAPELHDTWLSADPAQAAALMTWSHMPELRAMSAPKA